jgi:hypothetical protein
VQTVLVNLFEGSPIIIGGGSVNINFNENDYVQVQDEPGVYVKDDDELIALYVVNLRGVPVGSDLTRYVEDTDCTVTIHTFNDKGVRSDIVVSSRPELDMPGVIQLSFEPHEFPEVDSDPHFSRHRKVASDIEILDNNTGQTARGLLPADGRCIITFVNKKKAIIRQ